MSPLEAFLKQQAKTNPFARSLDDNKGDVNAARDVGRAFHILVPQVMDTLYECTEDENDRVILDAINQYWVAIYNAAIRYDKSSIDLINQFKTYVESDERVGQLYAQYATVWHTSLMTFLLVTFPVIFGMTEYETDSMAEYGKALNMLAHCEGENERRVMGLALKRIGHVPFAVSLKPFCKAAELFSRLVEEEREFHDTVRKEGYDG